MAAFEFETRLMANPKVREKREAYFAALQADREMLRLLPVKTLVAAIRARRLWTLPTAFDGKTPEDMVEAIARCMRGKDRPEWLIALGI